ncbi:ribosomal protein L17 [Leptospira interrogans str. 2003000735]|uniref:Large ribosomal subunit protein bL17 n=11 Tax=Leptospira interrogans TaxID=173 RepID=RL17_LEPIN|nr:50S ribosomal protein L17 [Leptospira interrogans]Q9XD08.2 RecName: Full=Large ribosomal subunit protein bL17; AltName: Full=50S ribosomal protein L17 [Leptospira interrogans serovar Lai str. 56601]EMF73015.1 ribosomal protein L17 [Leptospira interrogans serovar Canicola str. LT1962]EMG08884.1 ribosomal protein L17 [Leptospira interrogans serovar Grippotyphosa str. LT2186]EMM81361.1 ribosomal protein L17 [Leptospira interrogans str. 2006001854]EMM98005.1 ribosomal protein L17 [Leptospira in
MNKRNKVKHLNRNKGHRDALINNMITSLFKYERIESTQAKLKVVRSHAEKLITRAKKNLVTDLKPEVQLHNKREVMKRIKDREVVVKLFEDIAKRFETKNGGYTRVLKLVNRISDNSEVGILELTSRKERSTLLKERIEKREIQTKAREEKRATRKSNSAPVNKETTSKKK